MSAIRALTVGAEARQHTFELQLAAEATDATSGGPANLATVWQLLLDGRRVVRAFFYSPTRWFLVYSSPRDDEPWRAASPRVRSVFDTLLLGERQKIAAFAHQVCTSTVSLTAQRGLAQIGITLTPCKAPPMLALLARAGRGLDHAPARHSTFEHGQRTYEVLSSARPELLLESALPPAERHVLRRVVEGATYQEIAAERGTAKRTIANQVRAVFQRLRVTSRGELITRLLELAAVAPEPSTAAPIRGTVTGRPALASRPSPTC